jgi:hypothetical protein
MNLFQNIPIGILVIVLVVVVVGIATYLRLKRFRVSKIKVSAGPLGIELKPNGAGEGERSSLDARPQPTTVSNNQLIGNNTIGVQEPGAIVTSNTLTGGNVIRVGKSGEESKRE